MEVVEEPAVVEDELDEEGAKLRGESGAVLQGFAHDDEVGNALRGIQCSPREAVRGTLRHRIHG